jgi:hypothetical protein
MINESCMCILMQQHIVLLVRQTLGGSVRCPQDVKSVCPPSRNEPHEFFDMEDMEDTEVCRDDSMEDMEGKWRTTMASPARTEAETNGPRVS